MSVASAAEPGLQVKADPMDSVSRHTGWRRLRHGVSETVRVELTGEARLAGQDTNPNHRSEALRCKSKDPFDDRQRNCDQFPQVG
jgi:hypothetical protein